MKRSIIGILLIALSIGGILYWEFVGRDSLLYTDILTVSSDIEPGTVITQEMLGVTRVTSPLPRSLRPDNAAEILGKETTGYIPMGVQLYREYFEDETLLIHADKGEYIFSIPSSWLVAYPQTLRRGDEVTFLLATEDRYVDDYTEEGVQKPESSEHIGDVILKTTVLYVKTSSNDEVTSDQERLDSASTVSIIEVVATQEQAQRLTRLAAEDHEFVILYQ